MTPFCRPADAGRIFKNVQGRKKKRCPFLTSSEPYYFWEPVQAFCKSAEKLGEKDISLYLYRNGKTLCRDCQIHGFSLVFLDWEMPKLNGFDLAGKLYMENPR